MSLLAQLPEAPLFVPPHRVNSQAVNPGEWNDWVALGSAIGAGALWLWRHSLGGFCKFLWNGFKAPSRIEELFNMQKEQTALLQHELSDVCNTAEFALATSRIAWAFVEQAVLQFDSLGLCLFANDFAVRLLVRQQDEFQGSGWRTLVHPDDIDRVERQWDAAVKDRRNFACSFRLVASNGEAIKIYDRGELLHDRNGNVLGWYHILKLIDP